MFSACPFVWASAPVDVEVRADKELEELEEEEEEEEEDEEDEESAVAASRQAASSLASPLPRYAAMF